MATRTQANCLVCVRGTKAEQAGRFPLMQALLFKPFYPISYQIKVLSGYKSYLVSQLLHLYLFLYYKYLNKKCNYVIEQKNKDNSGHFIVNLAVTI